MKEPKVILYKGKKIFYLDFSNLKNKDQVHEFEKEASDLIQMQTINSALVLTNIENMYLNNELRVGLIKTARTNSPFVKASVLIGMYGLTSLLYNDFLKQSGRKIISFRTKEEALEYLYSFDEH